MIWTCISGCGSFTDSGKKHRRNPVLEYLGNGDRIIRRESEVIVAFAGKRSVICTSPLGGGIRDDLQAVFNHCDLEPVTRYCRMYGDTYEEHLSHAAEAAGLDPKHCAGLSTACFMRTTRIGQIVEQGIEVTLLLTGGINKNGRCAGDPATLWEENGIFRVLPEEESRIPEPGTINIILHINAKLTPGALAGAVMVVTEAKNAAIRTMQIRSCYTDDPATGSGTDGVIVIANAESDRTITQIRTDTKLGEAISLLIREKLTDSLWASMHEEDEGYVEE